jgi:hypothetical protein
MMDAQEYQAVERFFQGEDSEEAALHGRSIHDRLLKRLEGLYRLVSPEELAAHPHFQVWIQDELLSTLETKDADQPGHQRRRLAGDDRPRKKIVEVVVIVVCVVTGLFTLAYVVVSLTTGQDPADQPLQQQRPAFPTVSVPSDASTVACPDSPAGCLVVPVNRGTVLVPLGPP